MPFYTYRCRHCGHEETFLRSMGDRDRPVYHCDKGEKPTLPMARVVDVPRVRVVNPAVPRRKRVG